MNVNQSSNDLLNKISELSYSANVEGIATNIIETADVCNLITQYFNDLQPQWVSIGKEDNYAELMKAGSLTFWHKVHKCEVTGWIVKNELENLIQGEYSVIEMTKTTQWPIDAFTFLRAPSLPPAKELNHEE